MIVQLASKYVYSDVEDIPFHVRFFLGVLSRFYSFLTELRNKLYDVGYLKTHKLKGVTISVGNVVAGGTGKSPVVIAIANYLVAEGHRPAIVTRGFRSGLSGDDSMTLLNGEVVLAPMGSRTKKTIHADEAMMQSRELKNVPVVIGRNRFASVERFCQLKGDIAKDVTHWLIDDGFQHRKLHRDIDLVLLDSESPFGNRKLLPLGTLRESVSNLKRCTSILFTRSDLQVPKLTFVDELRDKGLKNIYFAPLKVGQPVMVQGIAKKSLTDSQTTVAVVSAISRPERFVQSLSKLGVKTREKYFLPDHWTFDSEKLKVLARKHDAMITTSKDYWRDPDMFSDLNIPVYVLPIQFEIDEALLKSLVHS